MHYESEDKLKNFINILTLCCLLIVSVNYGQTKKIDIDSVTAPINDSTIIAGLGLKGVIEIGKTEKENNETIGKGIKGKEDTWGGCVRSENKKQIINWIDFDSLFIGVLENGIKIGHTTRKEVYAIYGQKEYHNPGIEYEYLGIGFLFDNDYIIGKPDDILIETSVFTVKNMDNN